MADGTLKPALRTGRPRAAEGAARDQVLGLRLTLDERAAIDAQAARAGLTVSDYARRVILGHRVKAAVTDVDVAALVELNRLGVNLNQIAKQLNARKAAPAQIEPLLATIRAAVERLAGDDRTAGDGRSAGDDRIAVKTRDGEGG